MPPGGGGIKALDPDVSGMAADVAPECSEVSPRPLRDPKLDAGLGQEGGRALIAYRP